VYVTGASLLMACHPQNVWGWWIRTTTGGSVHQALPLRLTTEPNPHSALVCFADPPDPTMPRPCSSTPPRLDG